MNIHAIIAIAVILIALVAMVMNYAKLSKEEKITNFKEWLKLAVTQAEKALGSGTGQLKLRWVYDLAIKQFPWIEQVVTFEVFSEWVDEALEWMNTQISSNEAVQNYISE